jgi:hypothetical protein
LSLNWKFSDWSCWILKYKYYLNNTWNNILPYVYEKQILYLHIFKSDKLLENKLINHVYCILLLFM